MACSRSSLWRWRSRTGRAKVETTGPRPGPGPIRRHRGGAGPPGWPGRSAREGDGGVLGRRPPVRRAVAGGQRCAPGRGRGGRGSARAGLERSRSVRCWPGRSRRGARGRGSGRRAPRSGPAGPDVPPRRRSDRGGGRAPGNRRGLTRRGAAPRASPWRRVRRGPLRDHPTGRAAGRGQRSPRRWRRSTGAAGGPCPRGPPGHRPCGWPWPRRCRRRASPGDPTSGRPPTARVWVGVGGVQAPDRPGAGAVSMGARRVSSAPPFGHRPFAAGRPARASFCVGQAEGGHGARALPPTGRVPSRYRAPHEYTRAA